jgi:hypothetical protein
LTFQLHASQLRDANRTLAVGDKHALVHDDIALLGKERDHRIPAQPAHLVAKPRWEVRLILQFHLQKLRHLLERLQKRAKVPSKLRGLMIVGFQGVKPIMRLLKPVKRSLDATERLVKRVASGSYTAHAYTGHEFMDDADDCAAI